MYRKFIRIMKLTTFILMISLMQVSAASFGQAITLNQRNIAIEKVFTEIRKQTGYGVVMQDAKFNTAHRVNVSFKDTPLEKVINFLIAGTDMSYSIEDKTILISRKEKSLFEKVVDYFAAIDVSGRVVDEKGEAIAGATIRIKGTSIQTNSGSDGYFSLNNVADNAIIEIRYVGYQVREIKAAKELGSIILNISIDELEEVAIVNTGYQSISKLQATGSTFTVGKELLNRRVGTTILERLEDLVPGLIFNKQVQYGDRTNISIRGQSTISANTDPLIVLDNFPFDGDLSSINPNDVESISVLKDAASAAIWGARAGNGVIVITTKNGKFNQKLDIDVNSNFTFGQRPDLYYQPRMSTADYIQIQRRLFNENFYRSTELSSINNVSHFALPEVVEILILKRDGKISDEEAERQINVYANKDSRSDVSNYFYRTSANHQHALSMRGGSANARFFVSGGYDKNLTSRVGNENERFTLQARGEFGFFKNTLLFKTALFSSISVIQQNASVYAPSPYTMLRDDLGNSATVPNYRIPFIERSVNAGFLNWYHKPLDELALNNNKKQLNDNRLNFALEYALLPILKVSTNYQFGSTSTNQKSINESNSYFVRNLINTYTQLAADGTLTRPLPLGGIMDRDLYTNTNHSMRTQLSLDKSWTNEHKLTGLMGYEMKTLNALSESYRVYGYDDEFGVTLPVDYISQFQSSINASGRLLIPYNNNTEGFSDRFVSFYNNLGYSYKDKYFLTGSARLDRSNLFGVKTNQKGVPLFSVGASWVITEEPFWKIDWMSSLKIRASFGYTGNIDKTVSAYTTANYRAASTNGLNSLVKRGYAVIQNPPNPELRWERVKISDVGLDFVLFSNRVSGSIDGFIKQGIDLIGDTPFPPSSGVRTFRGNYANTRTAGVDMVLSLNNLIGTFKWNTNIILSHVNEKVTDYLIVASPSQYIDGQYRPIVGKPLYNVFSYPSAGLNPVNGNPRGYLNNEISENYAAILNTSLVSDLIYSGPMRPTTFGAVRNTFSWKNITASASIAYRLGHFYRRPTIIYGNNYGLNSLSGDYALRWQKSGDEVFTHIPSIPTTVNNQRDNFYARSIDNVESADHIRLQDLNVSYQFRTKKSGIKHSTMQVYTYVNNLGILYKKSKLSFDPDFVYSLPIPTTYALGIRANF